MSTSKGSTCDQTSEQASRRRAAGAGAGRPQGESSGPSGVGGARRGVLIEELPGGTMAAGSADKEPGVR